MKVLCGYEVQMTMLNFDFERKTILKLIQN